MKIKERIKKILECLRKYLISKGFTLKEEKPRCCFAILLDTIIAIIYTIISIGLILLQKSDILILILNLFCLGRALINNIIYASQLTKKIKDADIENKHIVKNEYYHSRAKQLGIILAISFAGAFILKLEGNEKTAIIKLFACTASVAILWNDCQNNLICAYGASIEVIKD